MVADGPNQGFTQAVEGPLARCVLAFYLVELPPSPRFDPELHLGESRVLDADRLRLTMEHSHELPDRPQIFVVMAVFLCGATQKCHLIGVSVGE